MFVTDKYLLLGPRNLFFTGFTQKVLGGWEEIVKAELAKDTGRDKTLMRLTMWTKSPVGRLNKNSHPFSTVKEEIMGNILKFLEDRMSVDKDMLNCLKPLFKVSLFHSDVSDKIVSDVSIENLPLKVY